MAGKLRAWRRDRSPPRRAQTARRLLLNARAAMQAIEGYDQQMVDRLCRAVAWAAGNEQTAIRLANMNVDETGLGSREPTRRAKILGILRDALRQRSMGIIEELPERGIVKYGKPAGVVVSVIPVTSAYVTPVGVAIYAVKCRDAVIFSPHPASRRTTNEVVRLMRAALAAAGAPADLLQSVERPSIPLAAELMSLGDLTIATGGPAMVKAAYSSGKPAYGVGAGNATMVIDETADVDEAARNTRISKTNDNGSGCSADGNLVVEASVYDAAARPPPGRRRLPCDRRGEGSSCRPSTGTRRGTARPTPSRARPPSWPSAPDSRFRPARRSSSSRRRRSAVSIRSPPRSSASCSRSSSTAGFDTALEMVRQILRDRRQGPLLRHLLVRRRAHPPAGARGAGQPHHGASGAVHGRTPGRSPTACR